jgi:hypothetical protein
MASMKAWSSAARELAATRRDCRVAWAAKTGERVSGTQIRPENVVRLFRIEPRGHGG